MTEKAFPFYNDAILETGASLDNADGKYAEATLYNMLRKQLPADWGFIWGVHLFAHQYDFLVLVPGKGVVNVECKGKNYIPIGGTNRFTITREGKEVEVDPLDQAAKAQNHYIDYLRKVFGYYCGMVGACVVFPIEEFPGISFHGAPIYRKSECEPNKKGLKSIIEDALSAAKNKLQKEFNIRNPVMLTKANAERLWGIWTQKKQEGGDEHTYNLVRLNLDQYKQKLEEMLTVRQLEVLRHIEENNRNVHFLIEGTAGTGKTFLAIAVAARIQGKVLFVCFNKVLAANIALTSPDNPNVTYTHFHKLDEVVTGKSLKPQRVKEEGDSEYWERVDSAFLDCFKQLKPGSFYKFDAIVVDEAQDLTMKQFLCLSRILKSCGKMVLFSDMGQTLYPNRLTKEKIEQVLGGAVDRMELVANLRNPKTVSEYCCEQRVGEKLADAVLSGPVVAFRTIKKDDINQFLDQEVLKQFNPCDVAVISPFKDLLRNVSSAAGASFYGPDEDNLNKTRKNLRAWHENRCAWKSTTYAFKGLEAMAVVHLVPKGYDTKSILYVGGSRATYQLYIATVE